MTSVDHDGPAITTRPTSARGSSDFSALARLIHDSGLMRRRYGYYWTKLVAVPILFAAAVTMFILIGDTWWQTITAIGFAVLFTQTAMLGHDAAHRQIFRSGRWNDWVTTVIGNLFVGMSYGWWQHRHTRHHANPNKLDTDPDTDIPVIRFTPEQVAARRNPVSAWLVAHQGAFFFPVLLLEGVMLHVASVQRLLSREPMQRRWPELALLTVRLVGFPVLVFAVLSPGIAVMFLAVQVGLFGFYMGASFAPNHKGMPLVSPDLRLDFLRRQVLMSRNIRGSRLLDIAMGGLNYQVEHHLFPSMPRPHLRAAAPIIAEYCREKGVPYVTTGLFESYGIVVRYINRVGLGERDPFTCPLIQQRQSI